MKNNLTHNLSRRERQVMDIFLSRGDCTAAEIQEHLPDHPSYSAVRALLRVMEEKGLLTHKNDGPRYVYRPKIAQAKARQSLLKQLLDTCFHGSREQLVAALLDSSQAPISLEELDRLAAKIEQARKNGR